MIDRLPLSVRAKNALKYNRDISSIEDMRRLDVATLMRLKNVGRKTAEEIVTVVKSCGLQPGTEMEVPVTAESLELRTSDAPILVSLIDNLPLGVPASHAVPSPGVELRQVGSTPYARDARTTEPLIGSLLQPRPPQDVLDLEIRELGLVSSQTNAFACLSDLLSLSIREATRELNADRIAWFDMARVLHARGVSFQWESGEPQADDVQIPNTLDDELQLITHALRGETNRAKVAMCFGWDGGRGATLQEVADRFGGSRERIRQIKGQLLERRNRCLLRRPWPLLDRTLAAIARLVPCTALEAELGIKKCGLVGRTVAIEGILAAAELLGRTRDFCLDDTIDRFLVPVNLRGASSVLRGIAGRAVRNHGAANLPEVLAEWRSSKPATTLDEVSARLILENLQSFSWLDAKRDWFWLMNAAGRTNRLLNRIRKVLAVKEVIRVEELHAAVKRHSELATAAPPLRILAELCRQSPELLVMPDGTVRYQGQLSIEQELTESELAYYRLVRDEGRVLSRPEAEDRLVSAGIRHPTASMTIQHSAIVKRFRHNAYGVVGDQPGEAVFAVQQIRRRRNRLSDWRWLGEGRVRLSVCLSRSVVLSGIVGIPAPLRQFVQGQFRIVDESGETAGLLRCTGTSSAWGLTTFLRRLTPVDKTLHLTFNLADRTVHPMLAASEERTATSYTS